MDGMSIGTYGGVLNGVVCVSQKFIQKIKKNKNNQIPHFFCGIKVKDEYNKNNHH